MAAMGFAFFLLCMAMTRKTGSESVASNQEKMRQLEDRISSLEESIPQTLQLEYEQVLITILDEVEIQFENFARTNNVSEMGELLRKELQTLSARTNNVSKMGEILRKELQTLSNHTLSMEDEMRSQTLLINKLSSQLEDVQSVLTCTGQPPSPKNGRPVDFEWKHGSVVLYSCDVNFVQAENSTVRCHLGKWEGRPPLCTRPATSALSLRAHLKNDYWETVANVSCGEESGQPVRFSRLLDTGTGWALPTDAPLTRGGVAVLDLSGVPRGDKRGVFQCEHDNETRMTFVISDGKMTSPVMGGPRGRWTRFDRICTPVPSPLPLVRCPVRRCPLTGYLVRPQVASVGDNVTFGYQLGFLDPSLRWLHDGQRVPAWDGRRKVEIAGVGEEDAGVYERYQEGGRRRNQLFYRLVMRGCPAGFFGQRCNQECPNCDNGGLCDEKLGTCVCAPGFKGRRCEAACGRGRIGPDCSEACDGGDCIRQLFCQPDPYGCSCVAGYWGYKCGDRCEEGTFGAECKMTCHCQQGSCDPFTGACSGGCSEGWTGASCQIPV